MNWTSAKSLSREERELADLLTLLIEDFEERHYSLPKATPLEMLAFLMEQHGLKQKDLVDVFGTRSIVSEVVNGKRELNKEHIRKLSERFASVARSVLLIPDEQIARLQRLRGRRGRVRRRRRARDRCRWEACVRRRSVASAPGRCSAPGSSKRTAE